MASYLRDAFSMLFVKKAGIMKIRGCIISRPAPVTKHKKENLLRTICCCVSDTFPCLHIACKLKSQNSQLLLLQYTIAWVSWKHVYSGAVLDSLDWGLHCQMDTGAHWSKRFGYQNPHPNSQLKFHHKHSFSATLHSTVAWQTGKATRRSEQPHSRYSSCKFVS